MNGEFEFNHVVCDDYKHQTLMLASPRANFGKLVVNKWLTGAWPRPTPLSPDAVWAAPPSLLSPAGSPFSSFPCQGALPHQNPKGLFEMNDEYDVIVLGTGLTVRKFFNKSARLALQPVNAAVSS